MQNRSISREASSAANQTRLLQVTVESLRADLYKAVEIAFLYGATEWVHVNYPTHYQRLLMQFDDSALLEESRYLH
ncbi:hypothetical protein [Candidatus Phyllobacterium onerii]|uniref:hypothetical protein n=1 Tax=Candidatus Phyllobacterium onerii TaxID=3020828 RepID=UPI00232C4355|nr:hypothetical protein [Phyllobacterium sp. IY22]